MNEELDLKAIGKRIRAQRENLNLSREAVALKIGVTSKFYGDLEYGSKGMSLVTLLRLSETLKITTDYMLKGYEYATESEAKADPRVYVRENIMAPLQNCSLEHLKHAQKMINIFMSAVNEGEGKNEE